MDFEQKWSHSGQLRRFLAVQSVVFLLISMLVCLGFVAVVKRLETQQKQIIFDANSITLAQTFEAQTLEATRFAALGRRGEEVQAWWAAQNSLDALHDSATSSSELALWERVRLDFKALQKSPRDDSALERLLRDAKDHQNLNTQQMEQTQRAGERMSHEVDAWVLPLMLGATLLVIGGEWLVWRRIFGPIVEIARTAENIRAGNLGARAQIETTDELGQLAATFNAMAGALQDRERGRLDFVAQVAHDLKNPLSFIGGAANLLGRRDDGFTPEERIEWLKKIEVQTKKLESLVGEMTDAAQVETGRLQLHLSTFDASQMSHELLELWRENDSTHHFEGQIEPGMMLHGDKPRLERVLGNLLSNAIKYSPRGRSIFLTLQQDGNNYLWKVRDEGEGLSAQEISRLFVPFSRLERTQKMASGSGLGLSAVKKIVEAHGGQIGVESQIGQGATFWVRLPCEVASEKSKSEETRVPVKI